MIDEEMSTDDADECEDEQPLSSTSLPEEKVPSHEKTGKAKLLNLSITWSGVLALLSI